MDKGVIIISENLIKRKQNLSLTAREVLLKALLKIQKTGEGTTTISVGELNISSKRRWEIMRRVAEELSAPFWIYEEEEKSFLRGGWFFCKYEEGELTLHLNPEIKPYISGLTSHFSKLPVIHFKSKWAGRLFEILWDNFSTLSRYKGEGEVEVKLTIDDLREFLNIPDSYKSGDIKRGLERALKEIEKTPLKIRGVEFVRKRRRFVSVVFRGEIENFEQLSKPSKPKPSPKPKSSPKPKYSPLTDDNNDPDRENVEINPSVLKIMQKTRYLSIEEIKKILGKGERKILEVANGGIFYREGWLYLENEKLEGEREKRGWKLIRQALNVEAYRKIMEEGGGYDDLPPSIRMSVLEAISKD
ncbi:MAG: hypothetical protein C6I01_00625 [Epsilonproteobacteria bacterium]|nr:hypothetical protein [Campylobacterota bacterium]NPA88919.1 replication initiation protein [Campylobacterota bacterium]